MVEKTSWVSRRQRTKMKTSDWIWIKLRRHWYKRYRDTDCSDLGMWNRWITLQITSKSIGNISIRYKKPGKTEEKMDHQCQRGSVSKRKWCIPQVLECVEDRQRWRKFVHVAPSSAAYKWRQMGQRRKRTILASSKREPSQIFTDVPRLTPFSDISKLP